MTPISTDDEQVRTKLGFVGPQNFQKEGGNTQTLRVGNHSTASQIRTWLGDEVFFSYRKLAIQRDPLDFLVSQYFYRMKLNGSRQYTPFSEWVEQNQQNVLENFLIAPVRGENHCDNIFRYETLDDDIRNCGFLPDSFRELFSSLNLKGNFRDESSRDVTAFYSQNGVDPTPIIQLLASSDVAPLIKP